MGLLVDKVAIITGAGGGIGRAHALLFAKEGARVVVNDLGRDDDGAWLADAVVEEIKAAGGQAVASHDSVAEREGVDNLVWSAQNAFGRVDILVNNAGILRDRTLVNMSEQEWDAVQAVHLRGSFLTSQVVGRLLRQQGEGGRIINTTSVSGLVGNFGQANYASAKMGIVGLTFVCAKEMAKAKVTVNAIAPVAITQMTRDLSRLGDRNEDNMGPQHIAPAALFLASDLAADITGKILGVQGGHLFEYRVQISDGVVLDDNQPWTAEQIKQRWDEICG